jgi:hypothetical protein
VFVFAQNPFIKVNFAQLVSQPYVSLPPLPILNEGQCYTKYAPRATPINAPSFDSDYYAHPAGNKDARNMFVTPPSQPQPPQPPTRPENGLNYSFKVITPEMMNQSTKQTKQTLQRDYLPIPLVTPPPTPPRSRSPNSTSSSVDSSTECYHDTTEIVSPGKKARTPTKKSKWKGWDDDVDDNEVSEVRRKAESFWEPATQSRTRSGAHQA